MEKRDIQKVDGVERDPVRVHRLLRSLARNQGSQVSLGTIKADMVANESDAYRRGDGVYVVPIGCLKD